MPPQNENEMSQTSEKQKHWDEITSKVEGIRDGLGEPVDQGIKETVVALKALGFFTAQSCEGHLDRGVAAPWVDIGFEEIEKDDINAESQSLLLLEAAKMHNLLEEYYEGADTRHDIRIIIKPYMGRFRIESAGVFLQDINSEETKKQKLVEYKEEMSEFTSFLKSKYFS